MKIVVSALIIASLVSAAPAYADCAAEVDHAFTKLRGGKNFRVVTKIVHDTRGVLDQTIDFVLPDRMHQRVKLGESPAVMETILVGNRAWTNQGQGWTEVNQSFADTIAAQMKQQISPPTSNSAEYECLGEKEFEGAVYAAYKSLLPVPAEERVKGEPEAPQAPDNVQTIYISKETGLPVRNVVAKPDNPDQPVFDSTFSTPSHVTINAPG